MARRGGLYVRPNGINGVKVSSTRVGADFMSARHEACPPEMAHIPLRKFVDIRHTKGYIFCSVVPQREAGFMQLHWSAEKSLWLKQKRNISFEDIVLAIDGDGLLDVIDHPNKQKYPYQKMILVCWMDYVYLVPCVKDQDGYFLKTIIPSRKATRDYL